MKAEGVEISATAAARQLGVGLDFVYVLLRSGKLRGRKVARQWRISAQCVEERRKQVEVRNGVH